jgi:hypothetical protein
MGLDLRRFSYHPTALVLVLWLIQAVKSAQRTKDGVGGKLRGSPGREVAIRFF